MADVVDANAVSRRWQCTLQLRIVSVRMEVYVVLVTGQSLLQDPPCRSKNNRGPRTEPCGTEHIPRKTNYHCTRYERICRRKSCQGNTAQTHCRSIRCKSSWWSTVSNHGPLAVVERSGEAKQTYCGVDMWWRLGAQTPFRPSFSLSFTPSFSTAP